MARGQYGRQRLAPVHPPHQRVLDGRRMNCGASKSRTSMTVHQTDWEKLGLRLRNASWTSPGDSPPLGLAAPSCSDQRCAGSNSSVRTLTDSIHNQAGASTDVNMLTALEDRPSPTTAPHQPVDPPLAEFPLLNFYKAIRANPAR
ncbi:hypothetical protein PGT21_026671 [Puccinia graminis f. sp. tritici]|uniref:Uncharacterized protein n=1 Tax=Puccinia graminis f. sp. tritici TaxID=56615 RepID=A0A5B0NZF5_PUCGR|nr:hypothetical protein PGT21_026671 [Puccinia graminis f. sp. tritici]KAA1128970.1 hypothetical protein PGTUg99_016339 [Puccinia graminis f. sp. tritici]